MNPVNPVCPVCGKLTTLNRICPSGARQYRCRRHIATATTTDSDRPVGRQMLGDRKLTQAERNARWKERDPVGYAANEKRKQEKRKQKKASKLKKQVS